MTFPIAITLSETPTSVEPPRYLFLANSNFDLAFNSGSVHSYDLQVMNNRLDEAIVTDGECLNVPADRCALVPDELENVEQTATEDLTVVRVGGLLVSEVRIGSFADGMVTADNQPEQGIPYRLYLAVRSDANLTYIDVNEGGQLSCGGGFGDEFQICTAAFRTGDAELVRPDPDLAVPSDPVDVTAGSMRDFDPQGLDSNDPAFDGEWVLMAHRENQASLFLDQEIGGVKRPRLAATVDGLAPEQVTVTFEEGAMMAWIPSQLTQFVSRVGIAIDGDPTQSTLFDAGALIVEGIDQGFQQRAVAFDPRGGVAYVVSGSPDSLLIARRDSVGDRLEIIEQVSLCLDPSRIQLSEIDGRLLAFITCFNGRDIHVVDVDLGQGITTVTNVSGAFEFVIDEARNRIYVADFSTSVIRIITLDPLTDCLQQDVAQQECAPQLIGIVGIPEAVSRLPR